MFILDRSYSSTPISSALIIAQINLKRGKRLVVRVEREEDHTQTMVSGWQAFHIHTRMARGMYTHKTTPVLACLIYRTGGLQPSQWLNGGVG